MNQRNPDGNSILQALLDLSDRGMGTMRVSDLITRISTDTRFRNDLQAAWNAHSYPEKSMTYAQLCIDQRLFALSDTAYKIVRLLGIYCHQSGLIQARLADICDAVGIKRTSAKQAIAELRSCGAIDIAVPSSRHDAPIYQVNPALINKGRRKKSDMSAYAAGLNIDPKQYLFNQELPLLVQTDVVRTADIAYNRLYMATADEVKNKAVAIRPSKRKRKASDPIPGQQTIQDDYPEALPNA